MRDTAQWYQKQTHLIKGFLAVTVTYTILGLLFIIVRGAIEAKSTSLMEPYNQSNAIISNTVSTSRIPVLENPSYMKTFQVQNEVFSLRRDHHYKVAMTFLKNYYGVIVCLIFISCAGGLLLFVLINQGWAGSTYTTKALFLSLATSAIFFSLFSNVFNQQKNFEDNMLRYMNYTKAQTALSQQISELSKMDYPKKAILKPEFVSTKKPTYKDSLVVTDTFAYFVRLDSLVAKNNQTINLFTDYILSIDASKMRNIGEIYKSLMDLKSSGSPDTLRASR
jgi:hypothetical protein